jgi:Rad3-related DNA helicase
MQFSLDDRTCALSVGEFAGFTLGPRDAGTGGLAGLWRAQLGQQWHAQLRTQTDAEIAARNGARTKADAAFEVPLTLPCLHRGWKFTLNGRIDQIVTLFDLPPVDASGQLPPAVRVTIREIKTISGPLPAEEFALRAAYPEYFLQVITYLALLRTAPSSVDDRIALGEDLEEGRLATLVSGLPPGAALGAELVFVEVGTGITQAVSLSADDEALFRTQLERLVEFLDLRLRARDRLRNLQFRPPFAVLRPGQETVQAELLAAAGADDSESSNAPLWPGSPPPTSQSRRVLFFEAPTGYGKTGVLLEFALGRLRAGRFARLLYLTGKSTGQLQVMRTLTEMTAADPSPSLFPLPSLVAATGRPAPAPAVAVAAWQVRPKSEHCINSVFHCVRDACSFLADLETRWPQSGLARFYLHEGLPHDLPALREAGRDAHICPYEITRAALPFNDVWIGDYNYVFSPDSRGVFFERPGFSPAETLLIIDEAHNLPARVADAYSHVARASDAEAVLAELHRIRPLASLLLAWEHWTRILAGLRHAEGLKLAVEDEIRDAIDRLATLVVTTPLDYAALGPHVAEHLWQPLALRDWLAGDFHAEPELDANTGMPSPTVPTLLWCPRDGELHFTCLDASGLIGRTLRGFGSVILASATLQPADVFAASCGLGDPPAQLVHPGAIVPPAALGKLSRKARKALRELTSGAALLQVEEAREGAQPRMLQARAPWRETAYRVGIDLRIDTTFQQRTRYYSATAATVETLHVAAGQAVVVFFPSYAYAESILKTLEAAGSPLRAALQPRSVDLAAQAVWVEESLAQADALFLVLGSSFAESIDLLGGRVTHAMVVGPALPEVNAIQRTRLSELERSGLSRDAAFRRVYQIPGMTKVNQALGRLVRAPGQQARVLLHCRRFADPSYATLLSPEYQRGEHLATDQQLTAWLRS